MLLILSVFIAFSFQTNIGARLKNFLHNSDDEASTDFKGSCDDHLGDSAISLEEVKTLTLPDGLPPAKPPRSYESNLNNDIAESMDEVSFTCG